MRCCGELRLWVYGLIRLMCLRYYECSIYFVKENLSEKIFDTDKKGHLKIKDEFSLKSYYEKLKLEDNKKDSEKTNDNHEGK